MFADEAAFQSALDADYGDHNVRLVYADWLEELGPVDRRHLAPGYRALGLNRIRPVRPRRFGAVGSPAFAYPGYVRGSTRDLMTLRAVLRFTLTGNGVTSKPTPEEHALPWDWFYKTEHDAVGTFVELIVTTPRWRCAPTRREIEDRAAAGFPLLPSRRQRNLLNPAHRRGASGDTRLSGKERV